MHVFKRDVCGDRFFFFSFFFSLCWDSVTCLTSETSIFVIVLQKLGVSVFLSFPKDEPFHRLKLQQSVTSNFLLLGKYVTEAAELDFSLLSICLGCRKPSRKLGSEKFTRHCIAHCSVQEPLCDSSLTVSL